MRTRWIMAAATAALLGGGLAAEGATPAIPQRTEIDSRYQWRLEDIYATDQAWEKDFQAMEAALPEIAAFQGRLGTSGAVLLDALRTRDRLSELFDKLFVYASMRHDQDTRVDLYTAMQDRISGLGTRYAEAAAYLEPEILALPRETLLAWVGADPGLGIYRQYLDRLARSASHTLNADEEQLLAMTGDVTASFGNVFGAFNNSDVSYGSMTDENGNPVELTKERYRLFQESKDRRLREESWKLFYRPYDVYGRTLASNLAGNVKSHVFYAKARKYDSALQASLDPNAIPVEVYTNLIRTVNENLEPLHRYVALRKKMLGVDTLRVWDMSAPLVEGSRRDIPFEDAKKMVLDGLTALGPEYGDRFRKAFDEGWIDVYETEGKRSGAYSWGAYATKPYLLLNYNGTLDAVFTLAHEMGHSMHSYYTRHNQPFVYGDYTTFVAEVASTTNEALMIDRMLAGTTDRAERLVLLNHYLEQIRGTFFTQVLFADVELQMHQMQERGEPLTKASLDQVYNDAYKKYFGPSVEVAELNGATWSRIPHFYYNFYVYQYATSYAAATALARRIETEGQPAVDDYLGFLKAGSSDYPIEILKRAGVDMTTPRPILDTIQVFASLVDRMEAEVNAGDSGEPGSKGR